MIYARGALRIYFQNRSDVYIAGNLFIYYYDPTGDYLNPQLQGLRLVDGNYFPLPANTFADGTVSVASEVLGLELRTEAGKLRFYDAGRGKYLLSHQEEAGARQAAGQRYPYLGGHPNKDTFPFIPSYFGIWEK